MMIGTALAVALTGFLSLNQKDHFIFVMSASFPFHWHSEFDNRISSHSVLR